LRIESKRFVEEETQRKRLGSLQNNLRAELAIFWRRNQNGRASSNERTLPQMISTTERGAGTIGSTGGT
jgi:23S rRNA maturation mini-RNase III